MERRDRQVTLCDDRGLPVFALPLRQEDQTRDRVVCLRPDPNSTARTYAPDRLRLVKTNCAGCCSMWGAGIQLSEQLYGDAAINGCGSAQNTTPTMGLAAAGA